VRADGTFESGLFHLTCAGETTWHGFASKIIDAARAGRLRRPVRVQAVEPIPTSSYPTAARRPRNSVLDNSKFDQRFGLRRQTWEEALALVLDDVFEREA
jgi:dTDP-4-dehydrorhamnose reductase